LKKINITVPDLGDLKNVEIIEILAEPGAFVTADAGLISVETDKATMEIPSPNSGTLLELRVKVGDKVSEGDVLGVLAQQDIRDEQGTEHEPTETTPEQADVASVSELECDLLVLGAGPGGYSAAFRAADLGLRVILVERYSTLGGVCLNVGCIPSKALLHIATVMEEAKHFDVFGVTFDAPGIDLEKLRKHKNKVVSKLTGGLASMAEMRKVRFIQGSGRFIDNQVLQVESEGRSQHVRFKRAIIAAGSRPVELPFLPQDDRIVDSTGALELRDIPPRMLIIGGGVIGLEMGTVYSALGATVDVVEMGEDLFPGADRDLIKLWRSINKDRFGDFLLKTKTVSAESTDDGIRVSFAGDNAPEGTRTYDMILQSVGRRPNTDKIGAEQAGIDLDSRGFIGVDHQQRTNKSQIFAIGDIVGQPMLAHKAVHEAHVAAEVIAGELLGDQKLQKTALDARVIPSVAYTDPEIAWVGLTEDQAKSEGINVKKGFFPWSASGRAIANGCDQGFTKLLFDTESGRIVGGGIVGKSAGDLIAELALAIEMCADDIDISKTIHPHPTLAESIGLAAEAAKGKCTDLPPVRH